MAKIIITDDEPMNRRMTEFMLTKNGYETVKAASGEECLSKLSDGADLVLLDVMMPGLNGFETLKRNARRRDNDSCNIPYSGGG